MPNVSVIVATYRRDEVLRRALESLAMQTYKDFEIILVDDNDDAKWNEKVEKIVNEFKGKYPVVSFQYIQNHPNLGSARTRNVGIDVAKGDYITFLDDDDIYCPERIINQLLPMKEKEADYSVTNLALYSESEKLIEVRKREYIKNTDSESLLKYHLMHHITGTDTMMFRKNYLMKIGGFDPIDVGDEFYLMLKAIEAKGRFLHVPICDVKAYVHTGETGLSSGRGKIEGENCLYNYKKQFFEMLDEESIRYIEMRHSLVIAYACLRSRKYAQFLKYGIKSFSTSPTDMIEMLRKR